MRLDKNPLFRKVIVPWWDSETACYAAIVCLLGVLFFGIVGTLVALDTPAFRRYLWLPLLLSLLSAAVIVSVALRLIRRYRLSRPG